MFKENEVEIFLACFLGFSQKQSEFSQDSTLGLYSNNPYLIPQLVIECRFGIQESVNIKHVEYVLTG